MHRVRRRESATHLSPSLGGKSEGNDRGCYPSESIMYARFTQTIDKSRTHTDLRTNAYTLVRIAVRTDRSIGRNERRRASFSVDLKKPKKPFSRGIKRKRLFQRRDTDSVCLCSETCNWKVREERDEFARQQAPDTSIQRMHAADSSSSPSRARDQSSGCTSGVWM